MLKHVGVVENTQKRCAIVFLEIPGKEDHALIVDTDALPDRWHQPLMEIIASKESQSARNLGEVLARRFMPDTNKTVLQTFHDEGLLEPAPAEKVLLRPTPNTSYRLSEVVAQMKSFEKGETKQKPVEPVDPNQKNFFQDQSETGKVESSYELGLSLVRQAEMLIEDARRLVHNATGHSKTFASHKIYFLDTSDKAYVQKVIDELTDLVTPVTEETEQLAQPIEETVEEVSLEDSENRVDDQ